VGIFDNKESQANAERARQARDREAEKQLGGFFSGTSKGRSLRGPGAGKTSQPSWGWGLGSRVVRDIQQENAKSGYFGLFGSKHVASKGREAQERARGRGWFSSSNNNGRSNNNSSRSRGWFS